MAGPPRPYLRVNERLHRLLELGAELFDRGGRAISKALPHHHFGRRQLRRSRR